MPGRARAPPPHSHLCTPRLTRSSTQKQLLGPVGRFAAGLGWTVDGASRLTSWHVGVAPPVVLAQSWLLRPARRHSHHTAKHRDLPGRCLVILDPDAGRRFPTPCPYCIIVQHTVPFNLCLYIDALHYGPACDRTHSMTTTSRSPSFLSPAEIKSTMSPSADIPFDRVSTLTARVHSSPSAQSTAGRLRRGPRGRPRPPPRTCMRRVHARR